MQMGLRIMQSGEGKLTLITCRVKLLRYLQIDPKLPRLVIMTGNK